MKPFAHKRLLIILAIAFGLRLTAGCVWQERLPGRFGMPDSETYWELGLAIAEGQPYECCPERYQVFRTPGYPLLLAPILWCNGDPMSSVMLARAEAALLGTLAVAAVWWLTRRLFDDRAALLAAVLATFYPGAVALSILVLAEAPFCPLMLLNLGLWIAAWQAENKGRTIALALAAGLTAGAATLMRPSWLLFLPFAVAVGVLLGRWNMPTQAWAWHPAWHPAWRPAKRCRIRHLWIGAWMILGLAAAMLPWWVRNAYVTGRFVPTTLQVGASLYDGLNPEATGASDMDFVAQFVAEEFNRDPQFSRDPKGSDNAARAGSFELRLDRRFRDEALAWAKANPGRAIELAGVKFLRMWNLWPNEARLSSWPIRLAVLFTYTPILICAIIGAVRTFRRGWPYLLCWLPAVYFTLLHTVFVSSIRYREPAMLAMLALAAGAIGARDWGLGGSNAPSSNP